jgi:thiol-disulfide isomerase/thioredoxin
MNNKLVVAVVLIIAAAGGFLVQQFVLVNDPVEAPAPPTINVEVDNTAQAIDFSLSDIEGNVKHLSDWNGRARLVNFWATWCAPCRREIPLLKKLQEAQGSEGLQVIGIAVDFMEEVIDYAEEVEFNYPILVGQEDAMMAAESSGVEFIGLPFTLVLSRDGELLKTHVGEIVEDHVERIVAVLQQMDNDGLSTDGAREALAGL